MYGFTDKALICFPDITFWQSRSAAFQYDIRTAFGNIITYLNKMDIQPYCFYTDDVARELNFPGLEWIGTLSRADTFFVARREQGWADAANRITYTNDELINNVVAKDPGSIDMSEDERIMLIQRHEKNAAAEYAKEFALIIRFVVSGKTQYKTPKKRKDGPRILVDIDWATTAIKCYLDGNVEDACDIMGMPYANRAVCLWPVEESTYGVSS